MKTIILNFLKNNVSWVILAVSLICLFFVTKEFLAQQDEINRYQTNQKALLTDIQTYKTEKGNNAAKTTQLEMTIDELKESCEAEESVIKELNIKNKYLENISTTGTKTKIIASAAIHDSIFYTKTDTIITPIKKKIFEWSDTWNKISGVINSNTVDCTYEGTDTLTVAVKRVPKHFLFFKWGTKYYEVDIVNKNKSSNITYNRTIKIKH